MMRTCGKGPSKDWDGKRPTERVKTVEVVDSKSRRNEEIRLRETHCH